MLLLALKEMEEIICRYPTPSGTTSHSDSDREVPSAEDWTEEEEQDADCVFCICRLSKDRTVEVWIRCAKYCRWSHTICDCMEEDFVCETGQRDSRFVLPCTKLLRERILQMFLLII